MIIWITAMFLKKKSLALVWSWKLSPPPLIIILTWFHLKVLVSVSFGPDLDSVSG